MPKTIQNESVCWGGKTRSGMCEKDRERGTNYTIKERERWRIVNNVRGTHKNGNNECDNEICSHFCFWCGCVVPNAELNEAKMTQRSRCLLALGEIIRRNTLYNHCVRWWTRNKCHQPFLNWLKGATLNITSHEDRFFCCCHELTTFRRYSNIIINWREHSVTFVIYKC